MTDDQAGLDRALERARADDPRGFEELFRSYGPAILGYLRARRVGDPDGLANEVFLRAFRSLPSFCGDSARFRTWLYAIARNAAIDDDRRRRRSPRHAPLGDAEPVGGDVETEALGELQSESVLTILDRLGEEQREVLVLRIVADLSVAQTASVVDKSEVAVKALQHRALAALRRSFAQQERTSELNATLRATT